MRPPNCKAVHQRVPNVCATRGRLLDSPRTCICILPQQEGHPDGYTRTWMEEGIAPLIASPALWFKLGWRIQQPAQQIAIPKQMLHNCVAACLQHAGYDACDLHLIKRPF